MKNDYGNWQTDRDGYYSEPILRVAAHRIKGLMKSNILQEATLEKILISAYLQGLVDAVEATKPEPGK